MSTPILILPGIGGSGPQHWQSLWEADDPRMQRVMQRDWDYPICSEWVETLDQAVAQAGAETILIAHSLACLMVAHWAASTQRQIQGAILVAVPDPTGPQFPGEAVGFSPLPETSFSFPSLIVASSSDPYGSLQHAQHYASAWGSRFINIGDAGHINAASGLGAWSEGRRLLETL